MGDAVTVYRLRHNDKLYKKWSRMDKDARRFMLDEHLDVEDITDKTWGEALKKLRKLRRKPKVSS